MALSWQKVLLGQGPIFTGMEHCALYARAVHMATGLAREVAECKNQQQLPELLPGGCDCQFTVPDSDKDVK